MAEKIRVGMVGTAHPHAPGKVAVLKASPDFELVGVCEADEARRTSRAQDKAFAGVRWVGEEDLLSDRSVRLIVVEGQVRDNVPAARRAVAAGKHVHLEKPGGVSLEEFRALLDAAQQKGVMIQMGYMFRYNPAFQFLFRAAREGWLGEIFFVRGRIGTSIGPQARRGLAEYPGGMMFELGCHLLDAVLAVTGPVPGAARIGAGAPRKVSHFLHVHGQDRLPDNVLAVFEFERGMAIIESAAMEVEPFPHRCLAVYGTRGTVIIEPLEPPSLQLCLQTAMGGCQKGWQAVPITDRPRYVGDFEDLATRIRAGAPPAYPPQHDLAVQEALLRACGVD